MIIWETCVQILRNDEGICDVKLGRCLELSAAEEQSARRALDHEFHPTTHEWRGQRETLLVEH